MGFDEDLKFGHKYEKKSLKYLDFDDYEFKKGYFKEYDLLIKKNNKITKIEIKCDRLSYKTGNLAIEYRCNDKDSGLSSTKADYWMYFIIKPNDETCYKIPVDDLRKLVKNCRSVRGGDGYNSELYLLKVKECEKYIVKL